MVISAGSFEASDENKSVILRPIDIVSTAGANADIYSVLNTLPGTQKIGETEGLFVRGGTAGESKTILDIADGYVNIADSLKQNNSEIYTLKGLISQMRLMVNPMARWQI